MKGYSNGQYEQQELLQQEKHVSMLIWAPVDCFHSDFNICETSFKKKEDINVCLNLRGLNCTFTWTAVIG